MDGHDQIQGTAPSSDRYSRLAPLDVDTETRLALQARWFFSPMFQIERRKPSPGQPLTPASGKDFLDYLRESKSIPDEPDRYLHQIRGLLDRMVENGLLVEMGVGGGGSFVMLPKSYYALSELSKLKERGILWLAKTLGGGSFIVTFRPPSCMSPVRTMKVRGAALSSMHITSSRVAMWFRA